MKRIIFFLLVIFGTLHAKAQTPKESALETLGTLTAFSLYDAYCVVGVLADAYSSDIYTAAYINQLLDEQITLLTSLTEALNNLNTAGFVTEQADKEYIDNANHCAELLQKEVHSFKLYISDPSVTNTDNFQSARTLAWSKISALLGIGE